MQFIYLEWTDSAGSDGSWTDDELELAHIKSVGIKVKETKRAITLAQSTDDNTPVKWDNMLIVPKKMITKRQLISF